MTTEIERGDAANELSTDLNVITAEINAYQRVAGEAIFEIGRRLKHVKENDLAHGEWSKWCDSIGMSRGQATKFITVFDELYTRNGSTSNQIGLEALYQIATMSESEREQPHTIPSTGETKTVDEMTVRELREVKKELKKAQEQAENERKARENAENQKRFALDEADRLRDMLEEYEEMGTPDPEVRTEYVYVEKEQEATTDEEKYTITNTQAVTSSVMQFAETVRGLIKDYAYIKNYQSVIGSLDRITRKEFNETVSALREFTADFRETDECGVIIDADYELK